MPYSGRASSIAIILFGSIYYTWVKNAETTAQRKVSSASSELHASLLPQHSSNQRRKDEEVSKLGSGAGDPNNHDYQLHVRSQSQLGSGSITPEMGKNSVLG